ncbi:transient receptor potential channel pyrexia-like [Latimeria chalumnae]|uniref:transient receptor potential channel pyrexia-like n=1 Tax=Latimeria chalumnae TaxID=7897 RepID=UPI00313C64C3
MLDIRNLGMDMSSDTKKKSPGKKYNQVRPLVIENDDPDSSLPPDQAINLQLLKLLLENGANINTTDKFGQTALHQVAYTWHPDIAKFLIDREANVNKKDDLGVTPLHVAAAVNYDEMVVFLLEHGADINAKTIGELQTPAHYAAKYDAVLSIKALFGYDAKITDARDSKDRTPLQLAAELDRSEAARLLLELGADAGVQDHSGQSCLTPMIVNMPPVAYLALDQFHMKDRANRKQYFFLNCLVPQKSDFENSQAKPPLEVIVQYRQLDLIMHPVVQKLIEIKWKKIGIKGITILLTLNLIFIIIWTILGIASSLLRTEEEPYKLPEDSWRIVLAVIAIGLLIYQIVDEITEIAASKKKFKRWKEWRKNELLKDESFCHPRWPQEKVYLKKVIDELETMQPTYLRDFWNIFDWIVYVLLFAVIATHIADVIVMDNSALHISHLRLVAVTIIFLWLRFMKHVRAIRVLGPFIVMLGKIVFDIFKFLFLYGEFYIPYACAFWIAFGGLVNNMETVPQMLFTVFRITLVDDYGFDDMYAVDPVMAYLLCGTFLGLSAVLCINLLIALLSDTFQRVYDNATANAAMQQASILLQLEESLRAGAKKKLREYIYSSCSPLALFFDDDLTIDQEEDLKKVTFQIKDELDELMILVRRGERNKDLRSTFENSSEGRALNIPSGNSHRQQEQQWLKRQNALQQDIRSLQSEVLTFHQKQKAAMSELSLEVQRIEKMISQILKHTVSGTEARQTAQQSATVIDLSDMDPDE